MISNDSYCLFKCLFHKRFVDVMCLRLVDVVQAGGTTKRLAVAKGEVLRLNQRHQLSSRGKHILLEDGLKCVSAVVLAGNPW